MTGALKVSDRAGLISIATTAAKTSAAMIMPKRILKDMPISSVSVTDEVYSPATISHSLKRAMLENEYGILSSMPAIVATILRFLAVIAAEFFVYFSMYRSKHGRTAVYRSPLAWILDALAIFSGGTIAISAMYVITHPHVFAVTIHPILFWLFFLLGSSQAMMHVIKWGIRIFLDS